MGAQVIFFLYGILLYVFALFYFPYMLISLMAKGKKRAGIGQRFGFFKTGFFNQKKGKRVWFHAVSVGETVAAAPLVIRLKQAYPDTEIYFSTVTETGNNIAHEKLGDVAKIFFFPFDFASRRPARNRADVSGLVRGGGDGDMAEPAPCTAR